MRALTVEEVLRASALAGASVLAGSSGLGRAVERLNVMEVPDILPWVKPREFLLTTAYPLRDAPGRLADLVADLDDLGLAGLGIKVGRYIDAVPDDMLDAAEARGFPIVRLPAEVGFDDILHEVLSEILNRQATLLTRSEESHHALLQIIISGGGWPEIARDLARLLDAAIFLTDRSGRIQATGGDPDGAALTALADAGLRRRDGTLHPGPEPDTVADAGGRGVLGVTISGRDREHGSIVAVQRDRPLDAADAQVLGNAATVAALVVTSEEALAAVESKYASDFLHDLLDGRVTSGEEAAARGAALGWDVARSLVVLVAGPTPTDAPAPPAEAVGRLVPAIRGAVHDRDPHAAVVQHSDQIVILTGAPDDRAEARQLGERVVAEATGRGAALSVGISRPVDGPGEVTQGHAQAERALEVSRRSARGDPVAHFDELGFLRLLALIDDPAELTAFAEETLGSLAGDDPAATELRRTLEVLLEERLGVAASARRLHFHYNTVRYRVDKLERLLGDFTSDPRLRLDIEVSLRILELRRLDPDGGGTHRGGTHPPTD